MSIKTISLNSKIFNKKEKELYKNYRKFNHSVSQSNFKAFHDTINFFKNSNNFHLTY